MMVFNYVYSVFFDIHFVCTLFQRPVLFELLDFQIGFRLNPQFCHRAVLFDSILILCSYGPFLYGSNIVHCWHGPELTPELAEYWHGIEIDKYWHGPELAQY